MNVVDRSTGQSQPDRSARGNRWWLVLLFLLLLGMCGLAGTLFGQRRFNAAEPEFIPVSLHSSLEADYRANPNPLRLPGVRLEIIWDAIYDREPGANDLEARKAALLTSLQTPVPVVTSPACQGQHIIYASRDTWIDSANQTATHGADTRLKIGRAGDETQELLLYFSLGHTLPAGSFIDSAHLELARESAGQELPPGSIQIYSLAAPFSEMTTTWANRPEPFLAYRSLESARVASDTWDVTDIVQDWLLSDHQYAGILLLPSASSTDFRGIYFSREAGLEVSYRVSGDTDHPGPRLVIDCGGNLPPMAVVAAVTASPTPTPIPTQAGTDLAPPTSLPAPTVTPALPLPQPTLPVPSATTVHPSPSPLPPEPTLPPPSPTTPSSPPTDVPPPGEDPEEPEEPEDEPDPPPPLRLRINDVTVEETDSGRVNANFNVTLSAAATGQVTVDFTVAGNTATAGVDFDGSSGALTFPPGSTRQTITVHVLGDLLDENDETFFVNLANVRGATVGDGQGRGTITDDDPPPALTIADVAVAEGDAGTVETLFTVSLSAVSGLPVTVAYSTANGSAAAADDYQSASGFLSFPPGTISQNLPIGINGDLLVEPNETFLVNLSNATNAIIADDQAIGAILNDDGLTISIADVTVTEGSGGPVDAVFVVTLSTASAQPVTVDYATADDTATSPADFTAIPLTTLTFNPGATTQTVAVTVQSDLLDEPDETFFVNLSHPSSGTLFDDQGLGTIVDDDNPPALTINDVTVTEGDSGTTNAVFTISLDAPSGLTVTVDYATANGTAFAGSDYTAIPPTFLTFDPGITTQPVTVTVLGDPLDETDETFFINLSNATNASISQSQGTGTIIDDDNPTLSINDVSVTEGNAGLLSAVLTVTLSAAGVETATVNYETANGTATAGSDYLESSGILTFSTGIIQQSLTIQVVGDLITETDETFFVNLSSPVNTAIADGQGLGIIIDDDLGSTPCVSPTLTLVAIKDSWLNETLLQQNANYGTNPILGVKPAPDLRHSLIEFELDSIPPDSVVSCAALVLNQESMPPQGDDQIIYAHRVITSWSELTVSWLERMAGMAWSSPGGDYDPAVESTFLPDSTGLRTLDITPLTQFWVDNPTENFGLLLRSTTILDNAVAEFSSREVVSPTLRPTLLIEHMPTLSINDTTVIEGETGFSTALFTVTLSSAGAQTITVDYATADNTATIADNDYLATSGTLTFTTGITTQTITVQVIGDTDGEPEESFLVNLSAPMNVAIRDGRGEGIIQPDISGLALPGQPNQLYLPLIIK